MMNEERKAAPRPRPSASLILYDDSDGTPRYLFGRRHTRHVFMPDTLVFPGGRLERADRTAPARGTLTEHAIRALAARAERSPTLARGLALCALRETAEETGLVVGVPAGPTARSDNGLWRDFAGHGAIPDLGMVEFVARAITPPRYSRRFDTRFFAARRSAVLREIPGRIGPDREFIETLWLTMRESKDHDLPDITRAILRDVDARIAGRVRADLPVAFFHEMRGRRVRDEL